jgi:hypothetical protein
MKITRALLAGICIIAALATNAQAGQLTIAVVQYSDARIAETLAAGFSAVTLSEVTNSDKVESRDPAIRGGRVLFAQTIPASSSAPFSSSTRLGVHRADVTGRLQLPKLKVEVSIQEGVDVGIRKFSRSVFSGSGALQGASPTILGIRESTGKTQSAIKGKATLNTFSYTTLVVAQWVK